ncbi:MAG: PQQ-binding-like beta-propeller repeat protein [Candidatus Omnitrophica bacterium]|nr:PQQ-binding-like beta-propeller repeat protein [Candidatus Omnitrophota bacterium]
MSPIKNSNPSAYTTIKGRVTDAETNQGVAGVKIIIKNIIGKIERRGVTDAQGNYYIKKKAFWGTYYVIATKEGYHRRKKKRSLHWGKTEVVNFKLEPIKKNTPPFAASVSPYSITLYTGQQITLRAVYGDKDGSQDIEEAKCLINTNITYSNSSLLKYEPAANKLYLRDDTDTQWLGGYIPGSNNTIENGQVVVDCAKTSISKSQTTIEIRWNIAFKSQFKGTKDVYVYVKDSAGADYGWSRRGTWRIREKTIALPKINAYKTLTNQRAYFISGRKEANTSVWINDKEIVKINSQRNWSAYLNVNIEGNNSFEIKLKDGYGHESLPVSIIIIYDKTKPQVTINPVTSPTKETTQQISGTYVEDKLDKITVNGVEADIDAAAKTYIAQVTLSEGTNIIEVVATDLAANIGQELAEILVDAEGLGTIQINSGKEYTTSSLVALDLFSSTAVEVQFSNDGQNWSQSQIYNSAMEWEVSPGYGEKTVYVRFMDGMGNWSQPIYDTIIFGEGWGKWPVMMNSMGQKLVVGDSNNDGNLEVMFMGENQSEINSIFGVTKDAQIVWQYQYIITAGNSFSLSDLDGDKKSELFFVSQLDQDFYCIDIDGGGVQWHYTMENEINASPQITDINNDGIKEVIVSSAKTLYCFNDAGKVIWTYNTDSDIQSVSSIADLDGDGNSEILINSGEAGITCVDKDGRFVWNYETDCCADVPPVIADIDCDGIFEILIGASDQHLYCLDNNGKFLWKDKSQGRLHFTPAIADLDEDGTLEIVIGSENNYLYCFNKDGEIKWKHNLAYNIENSPVIADLDNNGVLEILFGLSDGYFYCVTNNGELIWNHKVSINHFNANFNAAAIADLDNDNNLEVLFSVKHIPIEIGEAFCELYCLNKDGEIFVPVQSQGEIPSLGWPMYQHDSQRTGLYDRTPPTTPVVTDEGESTDSLTQLYASWASQDRQSGVCQYEYKITQDSIDGNAVREWTTTGGFNYVTAGLDLNECQTYYFGVKARNNTGMWSDTGYSDGIMVTVFSVDTETEGYTDEREVTLVFWSQDAFKRMVSEDSDFTDADWQDYSEREQFTLSQGEGEKTIYVKFQDAEGNETAVISKEIIVDTTPPDIWIISPLAESKVSGGEE